MSRFRPEVHSLITTWLIEIKQCYVEEQKGELSGSLEYKLLSAKIDAIEELIIDINEPFIVVDVSENIQQTKNVIDTQKIIDDEL